MSRAGTEKLTGLSRYTGLIVSTVMFLLLILALMGINAYLAEEVNYNRMRSIATTSLSPNINAISRDLYRLDASVAGHAPLSEQQEILFLIQNQKITIDNNLRALNEGGSIPGPSGTSLTIKTFNKPELVQEVRDILPIWQQTSTVLETFLNSARHTLQTEGASAFDNQQIQSLLAQADTKVNLLDAGVRKSTREILDNSQRVVIAGVILVIVYFIIFALYFMRKLRHADETIMGMQQETEHIMETVREGLFLVDDKLNLSQQYSQELEKIIGQKDLGGKNLNEVMRKLLPSEEVETTEEFIEQLFNDRVNEKLVADLNPLTRIKVKVDDFSGFYNIRYLDFDFSRVYQKNKIIRVLTTVNDVTDAVMLEERMDEERERNDMQTEMIVAILNTDKSLLNSFIRSTQDGIETINQTLQDSGKQYSDLISKINTLYREAHSIKGEASALKLHAFVNITTAFEEKLKALKEQSNLSGNDFLPLTVLLEEMLKLLQAIQHLMERIGILHSGEEGVKGERVMAQYFSNFVDSVAERNGKQVVLNCEGVDDPNIPQNIMATLKEIAIQLLRNSVVHGVENPQLRQSKGKKVVGTISMKIARIDNGVQLCIEDDGDGINFEKIRQKLIDEEICTPDAAAQMDRKQLAGMIFRPGMSTAQEVNEDAGRGVGMDVIKDRVHGMNGKIRMASADGQYTRFIIDLPVNAENSNV